MVYEGEKVKDHELIACVRRPKGGGHSMLMVFGGEGDGVEWLCRAGQNEGERLDAKVKG